MKKQKGVIDIPLIIGLAVYVALSVGQYERNKQDERHQQEMTELRQEMEATED